MNEIINFHRKKLEILGDAVEAAEATLARRRAEMDRLKRSDAPYADVVKASIALDGAVLACRKSAETLARFSAAGSAPELMGAVPDPCGSPAQVISLTR